MRKEWLATAAAVALLAGIGAASAQQEKPMRGGESAAPTTQDRGTGITQAPGAKPGGDSPRAQSPGSKEGPTMDRTQRGDKEMGAEGKDQPRMGADKDKDKARAGAGKDKSDQPRAAGQDKDQTRGAERKGDQPGAKGGQERAGEDKAEGKAPAQLTQQQRTRIRTTIIERGNYRQVNRNEINFSLNVGVAVPRTFQLYPLPTAVVEIVPAYRGYLFFIVGDEIVIVHPRTYEIVLILPA